MSEQSKRNDEVFCRALFVEKQFKDAAKYADKVMSDVPPGSPAYSEKWQLHFYERYLIHYRSSPLSRRELLECQNAVDAVIEANGVPAELAEGYDA